MDWECYGYVLDSYIGRTLTVEGVYDDGIISFEEGGCMPPDWLRLVEKSKNPEERKKRKGIKITYVESPMRGEVTITKIRGLLSPIDIRERFGEDVLDEYRRSDAYIAKWMGDINSVACKHINNVPPLPTTISKGDFDTFIAYARRAGDNLHMIVAKERRKAEEEPTEKTIII